MALALVQLTGNGTTTDFAFDFLIPLGAQVNVYLTLAGETANETNDLVSPTTYTLNYQNQQGEFTEGVVVFDTAPADGDIVTITPLPDGGVSIDYTAEGQLNPENLNAGYAQQTTPIDFSFGLYEDRSFRYDINVNLNSISDYNTLLPPLAAGDFFRRGEGSESGQMIAQDYDSFVAEIQAEIQGNVNQSVTDAFNWANADKDVLYTDQTNRQGYSAFNGAFYANEWAASTDTVNDPYGNTGLSARSYAQIAAETIAGAGGLVEEINETATASQTTFDLVNGNPLVAWKNIQTGALSVYVDGLRQAQTGVYTLNIVAEPTVADPSQVIFDNPLTGGEIVLIDRSEPQGQGGTMNADSTNALFEANSLVAQRNLDNLQAPTDLTTMSILGTDANVGSTLVARNSFSGITVGTIATTDLEISKPAGAGDVAQVLVTEIDSDTLVRRMLLTDFETVIKSSLKMKSVILPTRIIWVHPGNGQDTTTLQSRVAGTALEGIPILNVTFTVGLETALPTTVQIQYDNDDQNPLVSSVLLYPTGSGETLMRTTFEVHVDQSVGIFAYADCYREVDIIIKQGYTFD